MALRALEHFGPDRHTHEHTLAFTGLPSEPKIDIFKYLIVISYTLLAPTGAQGEVMS